MSIPYEQSGRSRQKARTRDALVDAARQLIGQGLTPTVEQAAEAAGISRTTAYRYFPNQRSLLVAAYPYLKRTSLLPPDPPADPEARLAAVVEAHTEQILELEPQLRTMLRLSLDPATRRQDQLLLRRGRAIGWIREALEPLRDRLNEQQLERLVVAIRATEGIEALVWLTDVGGLSRREAVELMRWSARALLRSALTDRPPPT
ncbi:MAG: TetR/AcrR family transcriptional regulator [Chloroflexota bacterium]|nr:TetR/AcrR family transcriptional regulator [Chloroflexota bacterium]